MRYSTAFCIVICLLMEAQSQAQVQTIPPRSEDQIIPGVVYVRLSSARPDLAQAARTELARRGYEFREALEFMKSENVLVQRELDKSPSPVRWQLAFGKSEFKKAWGMLWISFSAA